MFGDLCLIYYCLFIYFKAVKDNNASIIEISKRSKKIHYRGRGGYLMIIILYQLNFRCFKLQKKVLKGK